MIQESLHFRIRAAIALGLVLLPPNCLLAVEPRSIDFSEEIQPILRRNCFRCHGPSSQEAGLRLDTPESVIRGEADSGEIIVIPGDSSKSLLVKRIIDTNSGDQMPPDGNPLTRSEIIAIREWIDGGANWKPTAPVQAHWAYQPVQRPRLPENDSLAEASDATAKEPVDRDLAEETSPIDRFILRRLKREGRDFSPPLQRPQLLRRVHLALTGVPPTPEEVARFVQDKSEKAYERVVDKLLQSPHYGERWAVPWLDMARYADSNGFQADQIRDNWAYRDWVIRAFNRGMPFDQFVIDQIAGDLHEQATIDQKIATGFHRMTTCNVEAGVHPEANRVNQVVDRVNTTATVFLGTTLECAQCHDHKYDPFSQRDYYRFFAYFNSTPLEVKNTSGVTWDFYGPKMDLPLGEAETQRRAALETEIESLKHARTESSAQLDDQFQTWIDGLKNDLDATWQSAVPERFASTGEEQFEIQSDGSVLLSGKVPDTADYVFTIDPGDQPITAIKLDVLTDESIPGKGPGRGEAKRTNIILNEITCELIDDDRVVPIKLTDANADFSQKNWDVAKAIDGDQKTGWAISPQFGKPHWASFVLADPLVKTKANERLRVTLIQHYGSGRVIGKPRISLFRGKPGSLSVDEKWRKLARRKKLSKSDQKKLRAVFEKTAPELLKIDRELERVKKELSTLQPDTTLVMQEMESPRETFVMLRGDYENLAEKVIADTPSALPKIETSQPPRGDRMDLALWLTSRQNPLLSRVTVNRWWAQVFGTGLVSTSEDFGTQGERPSHPELLDWLACELMDQKWSMKHIHKTIVMSKTFRQSSAATPELMRLDPENRLLSRGPRFRLSAELIRDNALAISGLLSNKMHGPPIMPYQPENLWRSVGRNQPTWKAAENEDRFRRGVYVIWKRAAPYPSFINFDAPDRGNCSVQRGRTNTPLQALTLLNDPAYAEMALALADRIVSEAPSSDDSARIEFAMSLAVARKPTEIETAILRQLLDSERDALSRDPSLIEARSQLPFKTMPMRSEDRKELAAWFSVANALLNLDETMNQ